MASKDRQIPVLVGEPYCSHCGKGVICHSFKHSFSEDHKTARDQIHLDYHTKVVVIDANVDEGRARGYRGWYHGNASSRRMSHHGLRLPFYTESKKSFVLKPWAPYHKRKFHTGEPSHYDVFFPDDLSYDRDSDHIPHHMRHYEWNKEKKTDESPEFKKGHPHKAAGAYLGRARVATLGTLTKAYILYKDDNGVWQQGQVGEYEGYKSVRRRIEQANRKRRAKYRAYMKRATLWDHLYNVD